MKLKRLPAGFVIAAQPVMASKPPSRADWGYEIKHDGYRLVVRRDGPTVRASWPPSERNRWKATKRVTRIRLE
jgi:hypothetical protein